MVRNGSECGDVILRYLESSGFHLYSAHNQAHLAGPLPDMAAAIAEARRLGAPMIWQQTVDNRGRALGDPFKLLYPPL